MRSILKKSCVDVGNVICIWTSQTCTPRFRIWARESKLAADDDVGMKTRVTETLLMEELNTMMILLGTHFAACSDVENM